MTDPHRRTVASAVLAMTACLLLAACGSSEPAAGAPAGVPALLTSASAGTTPAKAPVAGGNACSLVTEADATTAMGADPGPGIAVTGVNDSSQCHYGTYASKLVLVNITPTQGQLAYDTMRSHANLGKTGSVVEVAGVGDQAFEVDSHGSAGIFFRKGDSMVVVSVVFYLAASPPTDQLRALAKLVASRI